MHVAHVIEEASSWTSPQTQRGVAEAPEPSLVWPTTDRCVMADREYVMKSEDVCKCTWVVRFESLLHRHSEVSKHESDINAVGIDPSVSAWHRIHQPPIHDACFPTKHFQAPRLALLELLLRVDPMNKTSCDSREYNNKEALPFSGGSGMPRCLVISTPAATLS